MASTAADRAVAILREVQSAGDVTVEDLAERRGVSPPTTHRYSSSEGLLKRTHAGATVIRPADSGNQLPVPEAAPSRWAFAVDLGVAPLLAAGGGGG